jgi:hypothetical protein
LNSQRPSLGEQRKCFRKKLSENRRRWEKLHPTQLGLETRQVCNRFAPERSKLPNRSANSTIIAYYIAEKKKGLGKVFFKTWLFARIFAGFLSMEKYSPSTLILVQNFDS